MKNKIKQLQTTVDNQIEVIGNLLKDKNDVSKMMMKLKATEFTNKQLDEIAGLSKHLQSEMKRLNVGLICDEYIEGVEL